jgi:hypothetical protein
LAKSVAPLTAKRLNWPAVASEVLTGTEANTTLLLVSTNSMVWEAVFPETTRPPRSATIGAQRPVVNLKRTNL